MPLIRAHKEKKESKDVIFSYVDSLLDLKIPEDGGRKLTEGFFYLLASLKIAKYVEILGRGSLDKFKNVYRVRGTWNISCTLLGPSMVLLVDILFFVFSLIS